MYRDFPKTIPIGIENACDAFLNWADLYIQIGKRADRLLRTVDAADR